MILAIDPGTTESGICFFDGVQPGFFAKVPNEEVKQHLLLADVVYCEMIASYGMPVGKEVFETVLFIGGLREVSRRNKIPFELVYRKDVKMHLCGQTKAKDGNIRQALIDRFGHPGTKKAQGLTYGMAGDVWQAFALAVTAWDKSASAA